MCKPCDGGSIRWYNKRDEWFHTDPCPKCHKYHEPESIIRCEQLKDKSDHMRYDSRRGTR